MLVHRVGESAPLIYFAFVNRGTFLQQCKKEIGDNWASVAGQNRTSATAKKSEMPEKSERSQSESIFGHGPKPIHSNSALTRIQPSSMPDQLSNNNEREVNIYPWS